MTANQQPTETVDTWASAGILLGVQMFFFK